MGLFDKKYCDVCGEKIGLFGNRKLEDGNLCKDCAAKLSPFFSDRRGSTVEEIKEQLAYREANEELVAAFKPTKVIGGEHMKLYFDEDKKQWLASDARSWRSENPDVLEYAQVTGCDIDVEEDRRELFRKDKEGNEISFEPPRYEFYYDFYMSIHVNSPWFSEIRFQVNDDEVKTRGSVAYREAQAKAEEIKALFTQARDTERQAVVAARTPKARVNCPACGATTTPNARGCCEYCGTPLE